jgi:hypothetical protein
VQEQCRHEKKIPGGLVQHPSIAVFVQPPCRGAGVSCQLQGIVLEFISFGVMNPIPDATNVALFRERLRKDGVIEELFGRFEEHLPAEGF